MSYTELKLHADRRNKVGTVLDEMGVEKRALWRGRGSIERRGAKGNWWVRCFALGTRTKAMMWRGVWSASRAGFWMVTSVPV